MQPIPLPLSWEVGLAEVPQPSPDDPEKVMLTKLVALAVNTPMGGPFLFFFDPDSAEKMADTLRDKAQAARTNLEVVTGAQASAIVDSRHAPGVPLEPNRQTRRKIEARQRRQSRRSS